MCCFAHRGPGHRPWVTDARSPAPRAPPPACPRFSPAESAPHMSHVTNSLCGGEFRRGRGHGARALQGLPIRSAQSRSPHSRVRDGHGAYRLCCGLACGDDARAPRHRASGPRRPLPGPRSAVARTARARAAAYAIPIGHCGRLGRLVDVARDPNAEKATGQNADAHGGPAQNPQNSRHRAETNAEEASAPLRLHRAKPPPRPSQTQ